MIMCKDITKIIGLLVTSLMLVSVLSGCASNKGESKLNQEEPSESSLIEQEGKMGSGVLLYQGHGSLRISTPEGKVIYIDPYAGEGYDVPADLILVTHPHPDHTAIELIKIQNPGCVIITHKEALVNGEYKVFDLNYVTVEAVQAGNNPNHDINVCVGYVLTLSDKKSIYISGDTSTTEQMATLAQRNLDYAFFCCDGRFNMDMEEASACAALVQAKNSIPYHMAPGELFNRERAELFKSKGRLIMADGEEIAIK